MLRVAHLLWHGASVIMVRSKDPWHSHLLPSVWQRSCLNALGLSRLGFEHRTFRLRGKRSYPLRHGRGYESSESNTKYRTLSGISCIFSFVHYSHTQKINIYHNINIFSGVFFVWNARICVKHSQKLLNLHSFTQWTYFLACKQI